MVLDKHEAQRRREPLVGAWLFAIAALVAAMILVGGATRLTDSGLAITEWDLGKGLTPPLSAERWAEEFALYQQTMEYQVQNRGMSLDEFRSIYWWEWGHRFLGKMIGVAFAIPFFFFLASGRLRGRVRAVTVLFALGGLQGAIGWWMVTSGLFDRLDVSPVRLAIHLGMALIILALALWLALDAFDAPRARSELGAPRWTPFALMGPIFAQAMFGALMAGADGGPAYADWPRIGGEWIPSSAFGLSPFWHNFTEDHATQHLMHRTLGYVVALAAMALALGAALRGNGAARTAGIGLGALALAQAGLGVHTVLAASALAPSLAHQAGAVLLWSAALVSARMAAK
jgi:cytochrome c oxidase assembly protein subunit 15